MLLSSSKSSSIISFSQNPSKYSSKLEVLNPQISKISLDLYSSRVQAGFPSPADDYIEKTLDLNEHLISHPEATFFLRVSGDSMIEAGIHDQDILVVDRSLTPKNNSIIIAAVEGELTVKRLKIQNEIHLLVPENPLYREIVVTEEMDFIIWGVVSSVVHQFV